MKKFFFLLTVTTIFSGCYGEDYAVEWTAKDGVKVIVYLTPLATDSDRRQMLDDHLEECPAGATYAKNRGFHDCLCGVLYEYDAWHDKCWEYPSLYCGRDDECPLDQVECFCRKQDAPK